MWYVIPALVGVAIFLGFIVLTSFFPQSWIDSIDRAGILLGYMIASFSLAFGIYFFVRRTEIKRWFQRSRYLNTGEDFEIKEEEFKGVVIPVSRREQPEWIIRHLKPRIVVLIYTEKSRDIALRLVEDYKSQCKFLVSKDDIEQGIDMLKNPDDPYETKELVRKHIRRLKAEGLEPSRIFVDTTGGKVPMSIGAFQAAEEEGVSSFYVVGTWNGLIKDPRNRSHGRPIFMSDKRREVEL